MTNMPAPTTYNQLSILIQLQAAMANPMIKTWHQRVDPGREGREELASARLRAVHLPVIVLDATVVIMAAAGKPGSPKMFRNAAIKRSRAIASTAITMDPLTMGPENL